MNCQNFPRYNPAKFRGVMMQPTYTFSYLLFYQRLFHFDIITGYFYHFDIACVFNIHHINRFVIGRLDFVDIGNAVSFKLIGYLLPDMAFLIRKADN